MKYVPPVGGADNDPYIDGNPSTGVEGSPVPAAAIEDPMREIAAVITGAGLVEDFNDLTQLRQAIIKMIQAGQRSVIINNAVFAPAVTGAGKAVYWDAANNRFDMALADGSVKQNCVGFADVANASVYAFGDAVLFAGLTPGSRYYLDGTTAGSITATAPDNAVCVGIARNATEMFIDIDSSATFGASLAVNGYQRLPSGVIIQWGIFDITTTPQAFTFPIAFPTACRAVLLTDVTTNTINKLASSVPTTTGGFIYAESAGAGAVFMLAIGH